MNAPRIPYAAKILIAQVQEHDPEMYWSTTGKPDHLNVSRTICFDPKTSVWLKPVLVANDDARIEKMRVYDKCLMVTFVRDRLADNQTSFMIEEADAVLRDQ